MNDLVKKLLEMNKKHLLNKYMITSEKEYKRRLINGDIDKYQRLIYDEKLLQNKNFIKKTTNHIKSIFRYADEKLYYDKSLVINVLNKGFSHKDTLIKLLDIYFNDIDVIKHILKNNGTLYFMLKPIYQNNLELIKIAIKHSWNENIYCKLKKQYKDNFELAILSLKYSKAHHTFKYIPEKFKNNPEIIKETLKNNGWGLQLFDNDIKNNKEYALMAVTNNGYALQFLSEDLKNDFDIVLAAFIKHPKSIEYASENIKEVIELV